MVFKAKNALLSAPQNIFRVFSQVPSLFYGREHAPADRARGRMPRFIDVCFWNIWELFLENCPRFVIARLPFSTAKTASVV